MELLSVGGVALVVGLVIGRLAGTRSLTGRPVPHVRVFDARAAMRPSSKKTVGSARSAEPHSRNSDGPLSTAAALDGVY